MTNTFFQRNTISNWIETQPEKEGLSKIRTKRAQSVSEVKINASKFQHREVFDSNIYQKVNFFNLGMKELNKPGKNNHFKDLLHVLKDLGNLLGDNNMVNFGKNYCNLWGIMPESN